MMDRILSILNRLHPRKLLKTCKMTIYVHCVFLTEVRMKKKKAKIQWK